MKLPAALMLFAAALPVSAVQAAGDATAELLACRAIADGLRRLACYDALVPAAAPAAAAAPARPAAATAGVAVAATSVAPPAVTAATVRSQPADFGLEAQRAADIPSISSHIEGVFDGWGPNTRFKLANGQVWQIIDGSSASYYLKDPKVTVARAALGSFRLEIDGAKQAPRVRRVE